MNFKVSRFVNWTLLKTYLVTANIYHLFSSTKKTPQKWIKILILFLGIRKKAKKNKTKQKTFPLVASVTFQAHSHESNLKMFFNVVCFRSVWKDP